MALKYHLDENMPHAVASGLKQRGVDVTTSTDASLIGATDEEQLAHALSQNRVLVTEDDDLLVLHIAGKVTFHDRSSAAVVSFSFPPKDTVTFSLASDHLQIEIGLSRCSTMLV